MEWDIENKLIIFEVSGTIKSPRTYRYENNYLTIAGQTAPSPGIALRGAKLAFRGHDILVQHIRTRVGDDVGGVYCDYRDGINASAGRGYVPSNVVIDHCSISWAVDENTGIGGEGTHNITYSNNIIAEGLGNSCHSKGEHSKGMLIGGGGTNISILKNLFAHNRSRNPEVYASNVAIINNVIYNPGPDFNILFIPSGGIVEYSVVGNITKPGPNTGQYPSTKTPAFYGSNPAEGSKIFFKNNRVGNYAPRKNDPIDWSLVYKNPKTLTPEDYKVSSPSIWPSDVTVLSTDQLQDHLLTNAGARPADRDPVDARLISEVVSGKGNLIDSHADVGGWPTLPKSYRKLSLPSNPHKDDDRDGYTNLEEWLHYMAAIVEGSDILRSPSKISNPENFRIKKN
jgi:hypothetical protein